MLQLNQLENRENEKKMPDLYRWAQLFKATTWEEIRMLAETNEAMKDSIVTLKVLTEDEKIRMQCEAREKHDRDMRAMMRQGYNDGFEKGMEDGIEQGIERGIEQGIERGIQAFVLDNLEENISEERIIEKLQKRFDLAKEVAVSYMQKYKVN